MTLHPEKGFNDQNHSEVEEMIERYLAGTLSEEETERVEIHILDCDDCYQKIIVEEQLPAIVAEKGSSLFADFISNDNAQESAGHSPTGILRDNKIKERNRYWLYFGSAAAVIFLLVLFLNQSTIENISGESFQELAFFEQRIKNQAQLRSDGDLRILSPVNNYTIEPGETIVFRWEAPLNATFTLKLMDNSGRELNSYSPVRNEYLLEENLSPGLYYWRVEFNDDFRIGKFIVRSE